MLTYNMSILIILIIFNSCLMHNCIQVKDTPGIKKKSTQVFLSHSFSKSYTDKYPDNQSSYHISLFLAPDWLSKFSHFCLYR